MSSWACIKKPDGTVEFRPCTPETAKRNYEENLRELVASLVPKEVTGSAESSGDGELDDDAELEGPNVGLTTEVLETTLKSRGHKLSPIKSDDSLRMEEEKNEEESFGKGVMSKRVLDQIQSIMLFDQDGISSVDVDVAPVDKPLRQQRFGAGRVLQYRHLGGKIMSCATSPQGFITQALTSSYRGAYIFLPGIEESAHNSRPVQTKASNCDTGVSPLHVKKMAAWGWYRTFEVYERAATNLALGGTKQTNMGLISCGHTASRELIEAVLCMRMRARGARQHAFTLYPRLLDDPVFPPSAKPFGDDDRQYYIELQRNRENVRRAELRKQFKEFAFTCLCEAMSVFLDWEEESGKGTGTKQKAKLTDPNAGLFGDYGSLTKLWESATKWSVSAQCGEVRREEFRSWWVRAAMARGHAEWLLEERWEQGGTATHQWKPMQVWRLLPPPPLGCYDNDCVVYATFAIGRKTGPSYGWRTTEGDLYFSEYNGVQLQMRELDSTLNHVPNYCFAPSAPDFVYSRKAVSGWVNQHIGLSSCDRSTVLQETGHYDRFLRQGLVDTLSPPVSKYERDLALCADHIVLEWQDDFQVKTFGLKELGEDLLSQLHQLEADIRQLTHQREALTRAEAQDAEFEEGVCRAIGDFLRRLRVPPASSLFKGNGRDKHISVLYKAQHVLRQQLEPWLRVNIFQGIVEPPVVVLYDQDTGEIVAPSRKESVASKCMVAIDVWVTWQYTRDLFKKLQEVAESIIKNQPLPHDEWDLAFCFQDYLTTGDTNKLPMVHCGTSPYRQISAADFYRKFMSNMPIPKSWIRDSALGHPPQISAARKAALCQFFSDADQPTPLPSVPRAWQCITDNHLRAGQSPGQIAMLLRDTVNAQSPIANAALATPSAQAVPAAVAATSLRHDPPSSAPHQTTWNDASTNREGNLHSKGGSPEHKMSATSATVRAASDSPRLAQSRPRGSIYSPPARSSRDIALEGSLPHSTVQTDRASSLGFSSTGGLRGESERPAKQGWWRFKLFKKK